MTLTPPKKKIATVADLLHELGDVSPDRICMDPPPGTATEQDILDADDHDDRLYELIDGVMLEKVMSSRESVLAAMITYLLLDHVLPRNLGSVLTADGMLKLRPGLVVIPDVSFIARKNLPGGKFPQDAIAPLAPDIAVEVLSRANTKAEMARKRRQYFQAGTRLVWEIDPKKRTVQVFTSPEKSTTLTEASTLRGGTVLPRFAVRVKQLFARLD